MNSLCSDMKFTFETQHDFQNDFLPTLDFQVRLFHDRETGCQQLEYMFFKNPMSSKHGILQTSALSDVIKTNTITQEVIRRLRNTSVEMDSSVKSNILQTYINELAL